MPSSIFDASRPSGARRTALRARFGRPWLPFLILAAGTIACGSSGGGDATPSNVLDAGASPDAGDSVDAGVATGSTDAPPSDASFQETSTSVVDAGRMTDAGSSPVKPDASAVIDAGALHDASVDAPSHVEAGGGSSGVDAGAQDASARDAGSQEAGAPGVRIVGRTTQGTGGPRFEWSGVNISARFSGTQISIELTEGGAGNEFEIILDGAVQPNLVTGAGTATYPLASGLAAGTHTLIVWRRTEASYGFTEFLGFDGFSAGGALLAPPAAPAHQIEVIGDSISCGFGIEGTATCTTAELESIENDYEAYGSVAARVLGADVMTTAWSGIGVYRNFNEVGPSTNTMPDRYDFAIPTDTTTLWDFSKYQPGAVVINLTSNDFSTFGDPGTPYITTFTAFVQHIITKYPSTYFFLVIEWRGNGSDSGPDVDAVVSAVQAGGYSNIEAFDIRPFADGNGCQGHPDLAGGQTMGNGLAAEIKRVLDW